MELWNLRPRKTKFFLEESKLKTVPSQLRWVLVLGLFLLLNSGTLKAQLAIDSEYGTSFTPTVKPGQKLYQVFTFENNTSVLYTLNATVSTSFTLQPGNTSTSLFGVNGLTLIVSDQSPSDLDLGTVFDYQVDPLTVIQSWGSHTITSVGPGQQSSPLSIPSGHYLYVVQEVEARNCVLSTNAITRSTAFQFLNYQPAVTSSISIPSSVSSISLGVDDYQMSRVTISNGQQPNLIDASSSSTACEGTIVNRTVEYKFTGDGPMIDPFVTMHLGILDAASLSLLEVDPNSVQITLELDLDGDPTNQYEVVETKTLFELWNQQNLLNSAPLDYFQTFYHRKNTTQGAAPSPGAPSYQPGYRNDLNHPTDPYPFDPNNALDQGFAAERRLNSVRFIPKLGSSVPAANTATQNMGSEFNSTDWSLGQFTLHLSRLVLPTAGSTTGPLTQTWVSDFDNNTVPYSNEYDNHPNSATHDNQFIRIFPGSKITVTYQGTHVSPENISPDYASLKDVVPATNVEQFRLHGFKRCQSNSVHQLRIPLSSGAIVRNTMDLAPIASTMLTMYGNNDRDPLSIDGTEQDVHFEINNLEFGPAGNELESVNFDYACSQLEFVVDLDMGLGARCPSLLNGLVPNGTVSANISFNNGNCANGTFGSSTYLGQSLSYSPSCSAINPEDICEIISGDNSALTFSPESIAILPVNGDCNRQRWIVRFNMNEMLQSNGNGGVIAHLLDAELVLKLKSFCPAAEDPKPKVSVKAYIKPQACTEATLTTTGQTCNAPQTCSSSQNCDEANRILMGFAEGEIQVNCPGCKTPGWSVNPGTVPMHRHKDFFGYQDNDNDGKPDGIDPNTNDYVLAEFDNLDALTRKRVRHGDVMTYEMVAEMYPGDPISPITPNNPKPGFQSSDLHNLSQPQGPITLNKVVYEVSLPDGLRNYFEPILKQVNGVTSDFPDDVDQADYDSYADQYLSTLRFKSASGNYSVTLDITEEHAKWVRDPSTNTDVLRVVFGIDELYVAINDSLGALSPPQTINTPDYFTTDSVVFNMNYITDVDKPTMDEGQDVLEFTFKHFLYASELDKTVLLGPSAIAPNQLTDKPTFDITGASTEMTWWCESGEGYLTLVPYLQSRFLINGAMSTVSKERVIRNGQMTKTVELGPMVRYLSGAKPGSQKDQLNHNYFTSEVRPTALPEEFVFYVPEPYLPEGIYVSSYCRPDLGDYATFSNSPSTDQDFTNIYVVDFKNGNRELPDYSQLVVNGPAMQLEYGISIEKVSPFNNSTGMPDYPNSSTDLLNPAAQVEHFKITVPVEYFYDMTDVKDNNGATFPIPAHQSNKASYLQAHLDANGTPSMSNVPLAKGDEYQHTLMSVLYAMPECGTEPSAANCAHFQENEGFLYYYGNYQQTTQMKTDANGLPSLEFLSQNSGGTPGYTQAPYMYLPYNTPLLCPAQVLEGGLPVSLKLPPAGSPVPSLATNVEGVNNYVEEYANFPGVVPGASRNKYGQISENRQTVLNVFHDQRTGYKATLSQSVVEQTPNEPGKYKFGFNLTDEILNELYIQSGACGTLANGQTVDNLVAQNSAAKNLLQYHKGGINSELPAIDLNNLYFYLTSTGSNSVSNSGTPLGLTEIEITKIEFVVGAQTAVYDFTSSNANYTSIPVLAGDATGQPNLFDLRELQLAGQQSNGETKNVMVYFNFLCDDQNTINKLSTGTDANVIMPFEVHINYHNFTDKEAIRPNNSVDFLAGNRSLSNREELTYADVENAKCSKDRVVEYALSVPKILLQTSIAIDYDNCFPKLTLTVSNNGAQPMDWNLVELSGLPSGLYGSPLDPWVEDPNNSGAYTYNYTITNSINPAGSTDFVFDLAGVDCSNWGTLYNITSRVLASNYCSACVVQNNNGCVEASVNDQLNQPNLYLGQDFSNYQPFDGQQPCATLLSGGDVKVNWSNMLNQQVPIANLGANEKYTFHFTVNNIAFLSELNQDNFNDGTFFTEIIDLDELTIADICENGLTITLNSINLEIACGEITCVKTFNNFTNASCSVVAAPLSITTIEVTDESCEGADDGRIELQITGGQPTPPVYTYEWNDANSNMISTSNPISSLNAGMYTVTVTDAFGCTISDNATVATIETPTVTLTQSGDFCEDGFMTLTVSGATFYEWPHDASNTSNTAQITANNGPATYTVIGNNSNNKDCDVSASIQLPQSLFECCPTFLDFTHFQAVVATPCATQLPNGQVQINWNNHLGNIDLSQSLSYNGEDYVFTFTIGGETFTSTLNAGTASGFFSQSYQLSPTLISKLCNGDELDIILEWIDARYVEGELECTERFTFGENLCSVSNEPLAVVMSTTNENCEGQADGTATASVSGGLQPYTYAWSVSNQNASTITGLSAGTYKVTVTDAFGCRMKEVFEVDVDELPELKITYDAKSDFCLDGFIELTVSGGSHYKWSTNPVQTTATIQVSQAGTYTVTGSNLSNAKCWATASITLEQDLFDCCPAIFDEQYVQVGGTISTDTYWPRKVILTSDVTVVGNATLDITNCDVITGYKEQGFAINVTEEASLDATNSTFRPCDERLKWSGIKVVKKANLHLSECVLINAGTGVKAKTRGDVYVTNNQLLNNLIGVHYRGIIKLNEANYTFTGNTVTVDDRMPYNRAYYGLWLDNQLALTSPISQNDFVLASVNKEQVNTQFYGVYLSEASAAVSHNTFTNVKSPYFQKGGNAGSCSFENNKVDYTKTYANGSGSYAVVSLLGSRSMTVVSGNQLFNAVGTSGNNVYGVFAQESDNLLIEGNRVEDFTYGIYIEGGRTHTLVENEIDNAQFGMYAYQTRGLVALDNHITDGRDYGILMVTQLRHKNIQVNHNYVEMVESGMNYGIYYINQSSVQPGFAEFHNNCVRNADYSLIMANSFPNNTCMEIPSVRGNSLFNYSAAGMAILGYSGQIGSCINGDPGGNTFSTYKGAQDVLAIGAGCSLSLSGNYPYFSQLDFGALGTQLSADNNCGVFGSSAGCGLGAGYVPTEIYIQQLLQLGLKGNSRNRALSKNIGKVMKGLKPEERLDYALSLEALLAESPENEGLDAAVAELGQYLSTTETKWLQYYALLAQEQLDEAAVALASASTSTKALEDLKVYEQIHMDQLRGQEISDGQLQKLMVFEGFESGIASKARMLLNEHTNQHPYVYQVPDVEAPNVELANKADQLNQYDENFSVYPVPATHEVTVSYRLEEWTADCKLQLTTVHGQVVQELSVVDGLGTAQFNLDQLAPGVYYVMFLQNDGLLHSAKVVKQ